MLKVRNRLSKIFCLTQLNAILKSKKVRIVSCLLSMDKQIRNFDKSKHRTMITTKAKLAWTEKQVSLRKGLTDGNYTSQEF